LDASPENLSVEIVRRRVPKIPTNTPHYQHGRTIAPVLSGGTREWGIGITTRAVANEFTERAIGKDCSKVVFPTRGSEEVGSSYPGIRSETEYCEEVATRGRSTQSRLREADRYIGLCWDDWEGGAREKVRELMKPR
jgi:hypothetical protein